MFPLALGIHVHTDTLELQHLCGKQFKILHGCNGAQPHQSVLLAADEPSCQSWHFVEITVIKHPVQRWLKATQQIRNTTPPQRCNCGQSRENNSNNKLSHACVHTRTHTEAWISAHWAFSWRSSRSVLSLSIWLLKSLPTELKLHRCCPGTTGTTLYRRQQAAKCFIP